MHMIKLPEPPRHRIRVRDLAKDVQRTIPEVLTILVEFGEYVSGPNGYVEAPIIRRVHTHFGIEYVQALPPGHARPDAPAVPLPQGLKPAPIRPQRANHPLITADERLRDRAPEGRPPWTGMRAKSSTHSPRAEGIFGINMDASPAFEFEDWAFRGFTEVERDVWLAAGLRPGQARSAATLRDVGLTPQDLDTTISGWTVRERILQGEGPAEVARLLQRLQIEDAG